MHYPLAYSIVLVATATLAACTGLFSATAADSQRARLHGLDPENITRTKLIAHCRSEMPHRRGRRIDPGDPRLARCVNEHQDRLIGELLRRMDPATSQEP